MNYGRAFSFVQEDPEWLKKLVIAALVFLIPVVGQLAVAGWSLEIMRRVISDEPELLPDWSDFGKYLGNGFKELVVGIVYALPALIVYGCGFGITFGLIAATGSAADSSGSGSDAAGVMSSLVALSYGCTYCVFILLLIVTALLVPPATGLLAETGELGPAFRFGEVFALLRNALGPYLISLLILLLLAPILASIGSVACGVGALFAAAYVRVVSGHMFAQAYKIAKANQSGTATSM